MAEHQACDIRLRAERKAGQLLSDREMIKGIQLDGPRRSLDTTTETLEQLGITKNQSSKWQNIANISESQLDIFRLSAQSWSASCTATTLLSSHCSDSLLN